MRPILTLKDLQELTPAYDGFRRIEDCALPEYYYGVFPKVCECGGEFILTEPGHTQLQCCNPGCWLKMGYRLAYFISSLGYKGFGEASSVAIFRANHDRLKYNTFLSAFLLEDSCLYSCLTDYYTSLFKEIREDLKTRPVQFVDAISALGIQNIGKRSMFFDVVKSPVVLVHYVIQGKTDELCDICGIQAPITRFQLKAAAVDIATLVKDVMPNILTTPKNEMYVAITGKVSVNGIAYGRREFIALCEGLVDSNSVQLYKIVETKAESKLDYVIADYPSSSEKYRLGQRMNNLITAQDFYNLIKQKADEVKEGQANE